MQAILMVTIIRECWVPPNIQTKYHGGKILTWVLADWITGIDRSNFLVISTEEQVVTIQCSGELKFNGIYESMLEISSNDPMNPVLNIPVILEVTDGLDIILLKPEASTITVRGSNHRGAAVDEEYEVSDLEPGRHHVGVAIYDPHPIKDNSAYSLVLEEDLYEETYFKEAWHSLDHGTTTTSLDKSGNDSNGSVSFSVNEQATVITSMNGQIVHNETSGKLVCQIDLSTFQKGVYFITIKSRDFVISEKIIKLK